MFDAKAIQMSRTPPAFLLKKYAPSRFVLTIVVVLLLLCSYLRRHEQSYGFLPGVEGVWIGNEELAFLEGPSGLEHQGAVAREIQRHIEGKSDAASLRSAALISVLRNDQDRAISLLSSAMRKQPDNPALFNNLSLVYLSRAEKNQDPRDLLSALASTQESLKINPHLEGALFNQALVLKKLGLRSESLKTLRALISNITDSVLEKKSIVYKKALENSNIEESWSIQASMLLRSIGSGGAVETRALVNHFPQQARTLVQEEILPKWGEYQISGDSIRASRCLAAARMVGEELVHRREYSIFDAVRDIESADLGDKIRLAKALTYYGEGVKRSGNLRMQEAENALLKAEAHFQDVNGHSFLLWTRLWLARTEYYMGKKESALARTDDLLRDVSLLRYPALHARTLWVRGFMDSLQTYLSPALARFRRSLEIYTNLGESENQGALEALIAETLSLLGEDREAWSYRLKALKTLSSYPQSVRLHNLLVETADRLIIEGQFRLAEPFVAEDQVSSATFNRPNPVTIAEGILLKARIASLSGRDHSFLQEMQQAREIVNSIQVQPMQMRINAEIELAVGELMRTEPQAQVARARVESLSAAINYYDAQGLSVHAAYGRLLRARMLLYSQKDRAAIEDLNAAIKMRATSGISIDSIQANIKFQNAWNSVFEESLDLLVSRRPEEAFSLIEEKRGGQGLSNEWWITSLGKNVAVVSYVLIRDRLFLSVFRSDYDQPYHVALEINRDRLESVVRSFVYNLVEDQNPITVRNQSCVIFDLLLYPIMSRLEGIDKLVIITDGCISQVPFAALLDRRSNRLVVEEHSVQYAASASSIISAANPRGSIRSNWRILAVGNPAVDRAAYPRLENLPNAESEARQVSLLYPVSKLLIGGRATPSAFLAYLPHSDVVHFAGHSAAHLADEGLARLFLAPDFGKGKEESVLYAYQLGHEDLRHLSLFVLSACDTAVSGNGSDGMVGFARVLLDAGVSSVLAAQWRVEDEVTREVLIEFHRQITLGEDGAIALRRAQLKSLARSGSTRHGRWAAFKLFGDLSPKGE